MQGSSTLLCRNLYLMISESERAAACQQCGICEEHCPQQLPIRQHLERVPNSSAERTGVPN